MNTPSTNYLDRIRVCASRFRGGLSVLEDFINEYPQFEGWSASATPDNNKPKFHHHGKGGLIRHTCEVIELGMFARTHLNKEKEVDEAAYFFAALFHDAGKMFDYDRISDDVWVPTSHRRNIHHISRSGIIWHDIANPYHYLYEVYHDEVLHAILAHHGKREYGSPIAPKSHVAWLLHHCDSISARMDDADRLDIVKIPT